MRVSTLALLVALLLPLPLLADTYTYTYTGNDFQDGPNVSPPSGPYTTSDFVTVTFTLSAPLGDNLTGDSGFGASISPLTWSISDGVQTDTNADPDASIDFFLNTNGIGQIESWNIVDDFGPAESSLIGTLYEPQLSDSYNVDQGSPNFYTGLLGEGSEKYDSGVWTESESGSGPPSPVPESPSFALLLLGGACLCTVELFRSRKKPGPLTA